MLPDSEQPFPNWRQALTLLGAGAVIFLSSCFGALSAGNNAFEGLKAILVVGTIVGGIVVIAGLALVLFVALASGFRALRRMRRRGTQ
jgi:hypothetical protein